MLLNNPILAALRPFLEKYASEQGQAALRKRLEKSVPSIVTRMGVDRAKNAAVWTAGGRRHQIRYSLYWLLKPIFKSGDVTDAIRDIYDDKCVALVEPRLTGTSTDEQVVRATIDGLIEQIF